MLYIVYISRMTNKTIPVVRGCEYFKSFCIAMIIMKVVFYFSYL